MGKMKEEDIKRLNYIKYSAYRPLVKRPHCLLVCILLYLIRVPYHIIKKQFGSNNVNEVLLIAPTINNQKSIRPIIEALPIGKYTVWNDFSKVIPLGTIYFHALAHFHLFLKLYFSSNKEDKKLIRTFYLDFITAIATYKDLERMILRNRRIKLIVFANDHILENRCLIEIALKHSIRTLYIQHASVTSLFPPLLFNYSFLDGLESYEKYESISSIKGKIFLTGSPRFDAFYSYKESKEKYAVGIALNEFDSVEKVLSLCLFIKRNLPGGVIVRPHPMMLNGMFDENLFKDNSIAISYPNKDLSYVFLSEINFLIANESGIHLDAALMRKPSILYNFSDNEVMDWYGYLRKGLIKQCNTYEELLNCLNTGYNLSDKIVKYYAASYGSPIEGKVGCFIARYIELVSFSSEEEAQAHIESVMTAHPTTPNLFTFK